MSSNKPRILVFDTYYREFLRSLPPLTDTYTEEVAKLMQRCFGTYDCYSRGLTELGWECEDRVVNHCALEELRMGPTGRGLGQYDVIFYQDLNIPSRPRVDVVLAGQISCSWPGDNIIRRYDILFTSFPHYVPRIQALGVAAVYLPLAFDPIVYERLGDMPTRALKCSFVGGLTSQFGKRKDFIDAVDAANVGLRDFGYGATTVPAWGLDMYRIYAASHIVLNIHHPAAEGYSNNLRMFEATGMAALLLTEASPNIRDFFEPDVECVTYTDHHDAIEKIRYYTEHSNKAREIASAGYNRTIQQHTYAQRLPIVDHHLRTLLQQRKAG